MKMIDNKTTLLATDLQEQIGSGDCIKISASYFSIYAYDTLKESLKDIQQLQFIFTKPTFVVDQVTEQNKKAEREFFIPKPNATSNIYGAEFEIRLKNKLTQKAIAKECADWIRQKAVFQTNTTDNTFEQSIIIQTGQSQESKSAYFPIYDFGLVGLGMERGKTESNTVYRIDREAASHHLNVFDQIWHDKSKTRDITAELIAHIEAVYKENAPERIYFLILYHLFKDFLSNINEDDLPNDRTGYQNSKIWQALYQFQKDAAVGLINKLERYNGCILADSVGLGKTYTALAVIKYYELRNKSVLVLCPKKLGANWTNYNTNVITNPFSQDRFNYDVIYHTDLSRKRGETNGMDLSKINWGNYDLVVIDESHNFRNRESFKDKDTRYDKLMNQVIRSGVKTKVLMLSATPVNNRFNDLKNQLALAYEGDSELLQSKLDVRRDIDTIFAQAQKSFNEWARLEPSERTTQAILGRLDFDFFKLLDSVTIARSRKHIQRFYDTKDIGSFPQRLPPISVRSALSNTKSIALNDLYSRLSMIKMSVYAPVNYIFPSHLDKYEAMFESGEGQARNFRQKDREKSLQRLMIINLLKRLESSVYAFGLTLQTLADKLSDTLSRIERFLCNHDDQTLMIDMGLDYEDDEDSISMGGFDGEKVKILLEDMDLLQWQQDLSEDLLMIQELQDMVRAITPEDDAKLQRIITQIHHKIQNPINEGNKKVIIFTAFADTADYLYDQLAPVFLEQYGIHTAKITGTQDISTIKTAQGSRHGYDMQGLLTLFAPKAKQKDRVFPEETRQIDILIATDCISEGQNLQDCDYLINYDIHWNPVRIIQRFGRIDRIGSTNRQIQLVNYWPDIDLDDYIRLKERVENRMVIVDVTSTGDDNVLSAKANDIAYRQEQLKKLQTEVLDLEDASTGVCITDLGLNDFRQDLMAYLQTHPDLPYLPLGLHAVVPENSDMGLHRGVIFALKARHAKPDECYAGQNHLYPYYLVYIGESGQILLDHTTSKQVLELAHIACRDQHEPMACAYEPFNQKTHDGKDMTQYSALLDEVVLAIQNIKRQSDIDSLFGGATTTALEDEVVGLDDFELIGFIVVQGVV